MDNERINYRNIAFLGRQSVVARRREGEVSAAHDVNHLRNTAGLTQLIGTVYGFTPRELWLAHTEGWFHDLVRSSSEDPDVNDEKASANHARRILTECNERNIFDIKDYEIDAITWAITHHGEYPVRFGKEETRESIPKGIDARLHIALFVADKLEANGPYVLARRSSFVAGDRLRGDNGDLKQFGFLPNRDESTVVALESIIRLSFVNPENIYPKRLKTIVHPLYEVQREFVSGLLAAKHLDLQKITALLTGRLNAQGKSMLQVRKLASHLTPEEITQIIETTGGITTEMIGKAPNDTVFSAEEAVNFFSENFQMPLADAIDLWNPQGEAAQRWRNGMIEYANGTWLNKTLEEIQ